MPRRLAERLRRWPFALLALLLLGALLLVALFWGYLEHWFLHSTVGPNLTATWPGMGLAALPAALIGFLLRPRLEAWYEVHHRRHAALHEETRAALAGEHAATRGMLDAIIARLINDETSPATRADIQQLSELVSLECPEGHGSVGVGRLCTTCHPEAA